VNAAGGSRVKTRTELRFWLIAPNKGRKPPIEVNVTDNTLAVRGEREDIADNPREYVVAAVRDRASTLPTKVVFLVTPAISESHQPHRRRAPPAPG
jgi:hypothetical protein